MTLTRAVKINILQAMAEASQTIPMLTETSALAEEWGMNDVLRDHFKDDVHLRDCFGECETIKSDEPGPADGCVNCEKLSTCPVSQVMLANSYEAILRDTGLKCSFWKKVAT